MYFWGFFNPGLIVNQSTRQLSLSATRKTAAAVKLGIVLNVVSPELPP